MKILTDTNIILDVLCKRPGYMKILQNFLNFVKPGEFQEQFLHYQFQILSIL